MRQYVASTSVVLVLVVVLCVHTFYGSKSYYPVHQITARAAAGGHANDKNAMKYYAPMKGAASSKEDSNSASGDSNYIAERAKADNKFNELIKHEFDSISKKQEWQTLRGMQQSDGPRVTKASKFRTLFPANNPVAVLTANQTRQNKSNGRRATPGADQVPINALKRRKQYYPLPFKIWVFWFGPEMSGKRFEAFQSMHNLRVPIEFVTIENISRYERPEFPFHPVIRDNTLSSLHVGDYMRAYFMYFYGGGYHDIKHISKPWKPYFSNITEDTWVYGVPDSAGGIACSWDFCKEMGFGCNNVSEAWSQLVCNSAYIMRGRTPLAHEWITKVHSILDEKREELLKHPAPYARCCYHRETEAEKNYPLQWAHLHGDLFHPLQFKYNKHVTAGLPFWDGSAYRGPKEGRMD